MKKHCLAVLALLSCLLCMAQNKGTILLEAEAFQNRGGWVLDQQFMDQMGSPYLLAHGMGKPVADAGTSVKLPVKGQWHVFARTWNWCAPWGVKDGPGLFKVAVNGEKLQNILGTGEEWGWEYAGCFNADSKDVRLELHDLTGFEGRCDAVVLSRSQDIELPDDPKSLREFRKKMLGLPDKPRNAGDFDLVVVGGGVAGLSATVKAAREGLKVALINNRPVPGGNNSTELKVISSGDLNIPPYVSLGNVTREIKDVYNQEDKVIGMLENDPNISYFPSMHVFDVRTENDHIVSAYAKHIETSEELEFTAPLFADCTGDGNLGHLAGAVYRIGREMRAETKETLAPERPDNMVLGASTPWGTRVMEEDVAFPVCDWAIQVDEKSCEKVTSGSNWWEAGFRYDQVADAEYIRDYLFRAIYGNWSFLKNKSTDKQKWAKLDLNRVSFLAGKRESRRLTGDVLFTQTDIEGAYTRYDDALIVSTYSIDQHFPTPKNTFFFPGEEFISTMKHYFNDLGTPRMYLRDDQVPPPCRIPYRCLYSANIDNMFMAGRNVSVSHIALASTRVQNVTGMMGEVVAVAAAICKKHGCSPREVYTKHLQALLDTFKTGQELSGNIFLVGDSQCAPNAESRRPKYGWGELLEEKLGGKAMVHNMAVGGQSTKTFIEKGLWEKTISQVKKGDLVLIQFGANDGNKSKPERYVEAYGDYTKFLKRFIRHVRAKGAIPVLVTSPTAHYHNADGTLRRSWGEYPVAMRKVAADTWTYLIDAEDATFLWQNRLDRKDAEKYYMVSVDGKDTTHFTKEGADVTADIIAKGLMDLGLLKKD